MTRVASSEDAGQRLDLLIAGWRGLSRRAVLRLLESGALTCNGRTLTRKHKGLEIHAGDELVLDGRYVSGEVPRADESTSVEILATGAGWVGVNKPAGVAVRPHALDELGTALNALVAVHPEVVGVGEGGLRSGVVHRLDTDTSGALVFALNDSAWSQLREAFSNHTIVKRYTALLCGVPAETGEATLPLRVAQHAPAKVEVCDPSSQQAVRACSLGWRVVEPFEDRASWVEIDLHTGFLHQIRVMMAYLGHAVVGDTVYGSTGPKWGARRQMLHALSLGHGEIDVHAPLPADMQQVIATLRGD